MRPLIKINQTYRELAGAIAAAITRSGTKLFHHKGSFYTEDFKLLSPERFTTWLETANICSFYTTSKEQAELANLSSAQAKIILGSEVFRTTFETHPMSKSFTLAITHTELRTLLACTGAKLGNHTRGKEATRAEVIALDARLQTMLANESPF